MIAALLWGACAAKVDPADSDTTPTEIPPFEETLEPDALHVIAAGTPAPGDGGHALTELSLDLVAGWTLDLDDDDGSAGSVRQANGDTVYVRSSLPPDYASAIEAVDAAGALLWSHDEMFAGDFAFAHGLAMTPDGDFLVADTIMSRVTAVSPAGETLWSLGFVVDGVTRLPNGLALETDTEGVTRIVVTELFRAGLDTSDRVDMYRLGGRTDVPTLEWTWSGGSGTSGRVWPHGPRFLDDGSVLVNFAALGQVAHFVDGVPVEQAPATPGALAFPRDTLVLPDGTWLIADAGMELVRVYDPYGRFEVVGAVAAPGVFGLAPVVCAVDGGLPCLPGP